MLDVPPPVQRAPVQRAYSVQCPRIECGREGFVKPIEPLMDLASESGDELVLHGLRVFDEIPACRDNRVAKRTDVLEVLIDGAPFDRRDAISGFGYEHRRQHRAWIAGGDDKTHGGRSSAIIVTDVIHPEDIVRFF